MFIFIRFHFINLHFFLLTNNHLILQLFLFFLFAFFKMPHYVFGYDFVPIYFSHRYVILFSLYKIRLFLLFILIIYIILIVIFLCVVTFGFLFVYRYNCRIGISRIQSYKHLQWLCTRNNLSLLFIGSQIQWINYFLFGW